MKRNASEFLLHTVACREYTLPQDDPASEPKGWIRGNTRIGPILEVTTSFQHFKFGVEVRIQSMKEDNSHSWVRISYGTIRHVNNYIKYDTQNLADPQEEEDVPTSSGVVAARLKAKAKPQPREYTGTTTIPPTERAWHGLTLNHQNKISSRTICRRKSSIFFDTIKNYIENKMEQFNSTKSNSIYGIIIFQNKIGLMIDGWLVWLQAEDPNEDISIALITWDQSFISVLFKDILGTVSLILCCKTTC